MPQNTKAITEYAQATRDPVALVLKWILLFTALICFVVLVWGTYKTYQLAPPLPQQFQTQSGRAVMTEEDIVAGKAGFQRADLMDYGSLYGMGSYFGEDYTAKYLLRLGRLVEEKIAQTRYGKSFADLAEEEQYLARKTMQRELQSTDLSAPICVLSASVSDSIVQLKQEIASTLLNHDAKKVGQKPIA
jgi:nitric oxide reductase subunit B